VVIGRGKVLADASVAELVAGASGDHVLLRTPTPDEAATVLHHAGADATVTDATTVSVARCAAQRVVETLAQAGVAFSEITTQRATLEDIYLRLTGGEAEFRADTDWQMSR
jgi:ABC-2 type transport system ATP-binding protein